jgi:hypothetical protein
VFLKLVAITSCAERKTVYNTRTYTRYLIDISYGKRSRRTVVVGHYYSGAIFFLPEMLDPVRSHDTRGPSIDEIHSQNEVKMATDKSNAMQSPYDTYQTSLTARYCSPEMARLFSQRSRHAQWRRLWLLLAESEKELGIETITTEAIEQMKQHLEVKCNTQSHFSIPYEYPRRVE